MVTRVDISHRIIAALVAAWVPFCCCFIHAAQAIASPDEDSQPRSCCSATNTCLEGTPADSEPVDGDPCCSECCVRVLPDAPQIWSPPVDLVGQAILDLDLPFDRACLANDDPASPLRARPPNPPPSASLLSQRCLLLV